MIDQEEEKKAKWWDELPQEKRDAMIKEASDARTWWGTCQGCGKHIEALGKDWPNACPTCGFGA